MSTVPERARALVERVERSAPGVVTLATPLSLAVRVEPGLLRAVRLRLTPKLAAGTEADLWFSPLVAARGVDGFAFRPDVAEVLRERLRRDTRLLNAAWEIVERHHQSISPALRLEERVVWNVLSRKGDSLEAVDAELGRAVAALVRENREGVAHWAVGAWSRLPQEARRSRAAWALLIAAQRYADFPADILPDEAPENLFDLDLREILPTGPEVPLLVRRAGEMLEISTGEPDLASPLRVPDTSPRLIELRWQMGAREQRELVSVPEDTRVVKHVGTGPVRLRTAHGAVYELPPQGEPDPFDYDVFLSHNAKDKPLVRELAQRLRADGLRVWFDEWVIRPGDDIYLTIERGLERSRTLVLVMSANTFGSEWVGLERSTALFRDPTNAQRRFLPLLAQDCRVPDTLRRYRSIDWRRKAASAYRELLETCRPATPETGEVAPVAVLETRLVGHTGWIWSVSLTPDGQRAVSASSDKTSKLWDLSSGHCLATLEGHKHVVNSVALTPDGQRAVSASGDKTLKLWDLSSGACLATFEGHESIVNSVAVAPDGQRALSASFDDTLKLWDLSSGRCLATFEGHTNWVRSVSLTPDGRQAISASSDRTINLWDVSSVHCLRTFEGHTADVISASFTPDGQRAISSSDDNTIKLWDLSSGRCLATFEGHTSTVWSVRVTADGRFAVSGSDDETVKLWDLETGACLHTLQGVACFNDVALSADGSRLLAGSNDNSIYVYKLTWPQPSAQPVRRYTNAKVVLVGESGVGKTGLAYRLAEDRWQVTESTHGMNVWPLHLPASEPQSDIEREVWLWDLAGQPEYRLVHQLFLDETAVALLLFDPSQPDDPFRELSEWEKALRAAMPGREPIKLLVATRTDRGATTVTRERIERFCRERGFADYLATSAKLNEGCAELKDALARLIPWDTLPWTSTTRLFKALQDAVVKLRDDDKTALMRFSELRQRLQLLLPDEPFEEADLRTVVGLLAGQGLIKKLDFGDFVLLQPELMNNYAAAVVRAARDHTDGLACIPERAVLDATLDFKDLPRLAPDDEAILLRAMVQTFLDKSLCIREDTASGVQLVFPSQYNRERDIEEHPAVLVTYRFTGELATLYTTLVVRLNYSGVFERKELWKNAAEFQTAEGRVVGLVMRPLGEGIGEIRVFFEAGVPDDTRVTFIKYIREHLRGRAAPNSVERERQYVCPRCGEPVENQRALKLRLEAGKKTIPCAYCDKPIPLQDLIERKFNDDRFLRRVQELDRQADINLDNQSRELILVGHAVAVAGEAGQIFRPTPDLSDRGIDGEIEFKDNAGRASGKRVYLQLKTGGSYVSERGRDGKEVFTVKNDRHLDEWQAQAYPVYLVVRSADGTIRWMDVTEYLRRRPDKTSRQIVFDGEPFTFSALVRLRDQFIPLSA